MNEQQIENLRMAYSIMAGIPKDRIDLCVIRGRRREAKGSAVTRVSDEDLLQSYCGSVACIAGWLSAHPYFQAQGLGYNSTVTYENTMGLRFSSTQMFGIPGIFDGAYYSGHIGAKQEALARIRNALLKANAITFERNFELLDYEYTVC